MQAWDFHTQTDRVVPLEVIGRLVSQVLALCLVVLRAAASRPAVNKSRCERLRVLKDLSH